MIKATRVTASAWRRPFAILAISAALLSCMDDRVADGPSSEAGNPTLTGIVRETSGAPAANSRVRLFRLPEGASDSTALRPPVSVDSLLTRADGSFTFDSLPPGAYALEGADAGRTRFALIPRADIPAGSKGFLRRDTLVLKPPGRISGTARRDANPKPAGVTADENILVRVAGTDRVVYTDSAGSYTLDKVPEGIFTVSFVASDGHYLPRRLDTVMVASGASVELAPVVLVWSPEVLPPAPAGLSVVSDCANALMRLAWRKVQVGNFSHYVVQRRDSADTAFNASFRTEDTVFVDTVKRIPAGHVLRYSIFAVNLVGNWSPEAPDPRLVPVPVPVDTTLPEVVDIAAVVLLGKTPAKALVRLFSFPIGAAPADSLPRRVKLLDSATSGADGRVVFAKRPAAGRYTLEAVSGTAPGTKAITKAIRVGLTPEKGAAPDTLNLGIPATLTGYASRMGHWCSHSAKENDDIEVSLAGTPYFTATDVMGRYTLSGVPPGSFRTVIYALPRGCFYPDTLSVTLVPGGDTALPFVGAKANPAYIPVPGGLKLASSTRLKARLEWKAVSVGYPELRGYEVLRREDGKAPVSSGVVSDTAWTDDVSAVLSGTRLDYVVRVWNTANRTGPFGGDAAGMPIPFKVP